MSGKTNIEWTDATWNPVRGCSRDSEGCRNCYAEHQAARIVRMDRGAGRPVGTGAYDGLVKMTSQGPKWTGVIRTVEDVLHQPLRWAKPRKIFVNSMSDLFHEAVPEIFISRVFDVMHQCVVADNNYNEATGLWTRRPRHTFQILTKRSKRMKEFLQLQHQNAVAYADAFKNCPTPAMRDSPAARWARQAAAENWYSDIHVGVSIEDQASANVRMSDLVETPAAVRFVSAEPLLGPIDLSPWLSTGRVQQVIVGGESGPKARSMVIGYAKDLVRQCKAAGVPVFVKQLGARPTNREGEPHKISDRKGAVMSEWPEVLRVREFPA